MELRENECANIIVSTDFVEPDIEITMLPESSFSCTACNLDFTNAVKLENHKKQAHDQIKIPCPICHTLFRRRDHMRRHLRTVHCTDKLSVCPICNQDCKKQDALNQHITEYHPDQSQYYCTDCQYTTDSLQTLISHKKIHVFINKYICEVCNACFKRQDHLNRHIKSLHLKHFVSCEVCKQIFKRRDHLQRHMREQHGINYTGKSMVKV